MSTITKLDPTVRRARADRRAERHQLRQDLAVIGGIIKQGRKVMEHSDWKRYTAAAQFKHQKLLQEMIVRETVMKLVLSQVSKIGLDPRRTGKRKSEIL